MVKISDVMTADVETAHPDDTLRTAAKLMADLGVGVLPVVEADAVVGMITDRDVTVRGLAQDLDPDQAKVRQAMTPGAEFCFEDDGADEVARRMGELQVRRLPVLSREKRLVGIVSLGDLAASGDPGHAAAALRGVSDAPADARQQALEFAGGKPKQRWTEDRGAGQAQRDSGMEPDDLKKGGF